MIKEFLKLLRDFVTVQEDPYEAAGKQIIADNREDVGKYISRDLHGIQTHLNTALHTFDQKKKKHHITTAAGLAKSIDGRLKQSGFYNAET